jgi:hypothetical protein
VVEGAAVVGVAVAVAATAVVAVGFGSALSWSEHTETLDDELQGGCRAATRLGVVLSWRQGMECQTFWVRG